MMHKILNSYMLKDKSLEDICGIAEAAGCEGVSIGIADICSSTFQSSIHDFRLSVSAAGALFLREDQPAYSVPHCRNILAACADVGIAKINVVLQSDSCAVGSEQRLHFLQLLAKEGEETGVTVCIEPLHAQMRDVSSATDFESLALMCRRVHSPYLKLTLDVCHCCNILTNETLVAEYLPEIASVHIADMKGNDPNDRCFLGEGNLPVLQFLRFLEDTGYCGDYEIEVISPTIAVLSDAEIIGSIVRSFSYFSNILILGELALHQFVINGQIHREVGGNSGMITSQLLQLNVQPYLLGWCGSDTAGLWIANELSAVCACSPIQVGAQTSVVTVQPNQAIEIKQGSTDPSLISCRIGNLPDRNMYGYAPAFPGYHDSLQQIFTHKNWKFVFDFGYWLWCGNEPCITEQLSSFPHGGYCALVNVRGLDQTAKHRIGSFCMHQGFEYAVLTDETNPLMLFCNYEHRVLSFPVVPAERTIDTCGAGDCLTAGILAALSSGQQMHQAVRYGMKTARHKIRNIGIWRNTHG